MDKTKEMVEQAKKLEKETIEKGENVMMKVFAINKNGETTIIAFADYDYKIRNKLMQGLGVKLSQDMGPNLESLMLVTDAYFAKGERDTSKMSPAEQIIMSDINSGKRRLEDLPPELHKYRYEALIIITSQNFGKKLDITIVPHELKDGKVVFGKETGDFTDYEDNMLSNVWKGYVMGLVRRPI